MKMHCRVIVTHGWPGSIVEQLKLIEPLTNPTAHGGTAADAFHVVIPSMPGYGFSGKPTTTGWGPEHIARAWDVLMKRLGYTSYVAQGGDWGAVVTEFMGVQAPKGLLAIHTNMAEFIPADIDGAAFSGKPAPAGLSADEKLAYERLQFVYPKGIGYGFQMGLRPQTLYGISDSPGRPRGVFPGSRRTQLRTHRTRLRWTSRGPHARRRPRQHHDHLADEHRRFRRLVSTGRYWGTAISTSGASRSRLP